MTNQSFDIPKTLSLENKKNNSYLFDNVIYRIEIDLIRIFLIINFYFSQKN